MTWFLSVLAAERDRCILWLPVFLGVGIGGYFALPSEPALFAGPLAAASGGALWLAGFARRRHPAALTVMALAAAVAVTGAGLALAQWRTQAVDTVMLTARLGPTTVSGRVRHVETFPGSYRVVIDRPRIGGLAAHVTPARIRLRVRGDAGTARPGDWIRTRAVVSPPSPPAAPGAFDFQRHAYFQAIGGVGFTLGSPDVTAPAGYDDLETTVARVRASVTRRILDALPGPRGGIAAALVTEERSAVPKPVLAAIRDSGLAHLLAISGLHIGLVAGLLFAAARAALALAPALALRYPVKKWAAAVTVAGAFGYAVLAGATLPTQRAFLMIGLALLGVILDRRGLSMRSVAWAALAILAVQPESLISASFQMSFAAVIALVAAYEALAARRIDADAAVGRRGWARRLLGYLGGIALTTLIAGAATAPFAVFQFNRIADYGVIANLIAVPVTGLWVMPWAICALALMPFGGAALALAPMGAGIDVIIAVAERVAAWPGAVTLVPAMPTAALALTAAGGLWLCPWRQPCAWPGQLACWPGWRWWR